MPASTSDEPRRWWTTALVGAIGFALFSLALLEGMARSVLAHSVPDLPRDERSQGYQWDPELGWAPRPHGRVRLEGPPEFLAEHNSRGYRDAEYLDGDPRKRLLVVGDSFVWGYGVTRKQRFTDRLETLLQDVRVINLGVSGYGTDQELLLLKRELDFFAPDIVLLLYVGGGDDHDRKANRTNHRFRWYYKPYFVVGDAGLELAGVPVPRSYPDLIESAPLGLGSSRLFRAGAASWSRYRHGVVLVDDPTVEIVSEMHRFVRSAGAGFILGYIDPAPGLAESCRETSAMPCIDLSPIGTHGATPRDRAHWSPEDHAEAARAIRDLLVDRGLATSRQPGAA